MNYLKNGEYYYSYSDLLGSGSFGKVLKCYRAKDKNIFALKIIDKVKLRAQGDYLVKALEREIATQKIATESGLPFYVGLIENFEDEKNIYLVLEYCERSLMEFLASRQLTEQQCLELVFQVALGLNYLHSIHITHRDIKPDNILIKDGVLKIADFGFASNSSMLMTNLGTAPYMSPELFLDGDEAYTPKVDVWALNTCLYKLLTGQFYFWSPNRLLMERLIRNKEFTIGSELQNVTPETRDLLLNGYIKDPHKRLSMEQYVCHDAFQQIRKNYEPMMQKSFNPVVTSPNKIDTLLNSGIIELFLRYRNNLLAYSKLGFQLYQAGFNKLISFYLLKKHIQSLSGIVYCFKKKQVPRFSPFDKKSVAVNDWNQLCSSQEFFKVLCLMLDDLSTLTIRYGELFKDIQLAVQHDTRLAYLKDPRNLNTLFDLNVCYKEESMKSFFDEFINKTSQIKNHDFGDMIMLMRKIQLYEVHNPTDIFK